MQVAWGSEGSTFYSMRMQRMFFYFFYSFTFLINHFMSKAILIDVVNKNISYTTINDYKEIYNAIGHGCNTFDCPYQFDNGDTLYVDDEGLLHDDVHGCFMLQGWNIPCVGNAIILGTNDEGESIDCKCTIEEIQNQIKFFSKDVALAWRDAALSNGAQIIQF